MFLFRNASMLRYTTLVLAVAALAACNRGPQGVRFTKEGTVNTDGPANKADVQPIRQFTAPEIQAAITGRTFQYTRPDGNGFVTYNADGTFSFQDDVRGQGIGHWAVNNGQFCETFGAGTVQDCGDFKSTGDAYFAAKSRLVEMKT